MLALLGVDAIADLEVPYVERPVASPPAVASGPWEARDSAPRRKAGRMVFSNTPFSSGAFAIGILALLRNKVYRQIFWRYRPEPAG